MAGVQTTAIFIFNEHGTGKRKSTAPWWHVCRFDSHACSAFSHVKLFPIQNTWNHNNPEQRLWSSQEAGELHIPKLCRHVMKISLVSNVAWNCMEEVRQNRQIIWLFHSVIVFLVLGSYIQSEYAYCRCSWCFKTFAVIVITNQVGKLVSLHTEVMGSGKKQKKQAASQHYFDFCQHWKAGNSCLTEQAGQAVSGSSQTFLLAHSSPYDVRPGHFTQTEEWRNHESSSLKDPRDPRALQVASGLYAQLHVKLRGAKYSAVSQLTYSDSNINLFLTHTIHRKYHKLFSAGYNVSPQRYIKPQESKSHQRNLI